MKREVLKVSLRKNGVVIPLEWMLQESNDGISETTNVLHANCVKLGYSFSEELLHAMNAISPKAKLELFELLKEISGVTKNWTPLVKQWNVPTGESKVDHLVTWFANKFQSTRGTKLQCGHLIPENTFPIERYNGCPYCGTPFSFGDLDYSPSVNKLKVLNLWTEADVKNELNGLLTSPVALDASQVDSLKILLSVYGVPSGIEISMKETVMLVLDTLIENGRTEEVGKLFKTPNDVLRFLWYKNTGLLQLVDPKTIANRMRKNAVHLNVLLDQSREVKVKAISDLKLKFSRGECRQYAIWLSGLNMSVADQCEIMHPKRGMWVRVIRALRLAEYSQRPGFEKLAELLDVFYNQKYEVWQGRVEENKRTMNAGETFRLLKQRPGLFARSLFSSMLWFGPDVTIEHFKEVIDKIPARLIFTLNMYAEVYFDKMATRTVKPLGGVNKKIPVNQLLKLYSNEELGRMKSLVEALSLETIKLKWQKEENTNSTMFIDQGLFNVPIAIGDRGEHVQDVQGALLGTKFKIEGDTVRLFMQWGKGLPAQHLDMDLSCNVFYSTRSEFCSYAQLVITGCKHSGDIRSIPNRVGTAEYVNIDLNELEKAHAKYVMFTCNAYSNGALSPNLVVGWMNSKSPMKISESGVAYDPTAVQHQVRINQSLTKGLVFGVLEVEKREITWLEMSFDGQLVQAANLENVMGLLSKLKAKLKLGTLLEIKAAVHNLTIVDDPEKADEVYSLDWAKNTAEVSKFFLE